MQEHYIEETNDWTAEEQNKKGRQAIHLHLQTHFTSSMTGTESSCTYWEAKPKNPDKKVYYTRNLSKINLYCKDITLYFQNPHSNKPRITQLDHNQ